MQNNKLIEALSVNVRWWANCGNTPDFGITVAEEDEYSTHDVVRHMIRLDKEHVILVGAANGFAHYGTYSIRPESNSEHKPFWSKGTQKMFVYDKDNNAVEREVYGYGAGRATYINTLLKDKTKSIFDCGIKGKYNMAAAVTSEYVHQVLAPLAKKDDIYFLAVKEIVDQPVCADSESEQLRIIPSLSPTEIVFPKEIEWKQRGCRKEYRVQFAFGFEDYHSEIAEAADKGTIGKEVTTPVKLS